MSFLEQISHHLNSLNGLIKRGICFCNWAYCSKQTWFASLDQLSSWRVWGGEEWASWIDARLLASGFKGAIRGGRMERTRSRGSCVLRGNDCVWHTYKREFRVPAGCCHHQRRSHSVRSCWKRKQNGGIVSLLLIKTYATHAPPSFWTWSVNQVWLPSRHLVTLLFLAIPDKVFGAADGLPSIVACALMRHCVELVMDRVVHASSKSCP